MAGANTYTSIGSLLKPTFGKLVSVVPETFQIQKLFPAESGEVAPGNYFSEPVEVQHAWSSTAMGNVSGESDTTLTLQDAQYDVTKLAQVYPYKYVERRKTSVAMIDLSESESQAFAKARVRTAKRMVVQLRRTLEAELLHGQRGLGTVASFAGSGTTGVVTLAAGSYAPALLADLEGAYVTMLNNASDPTAVSGSAGYVSKVDTAAGTFNLYTTRTGSTGVTSSIGTGNVMVLTGYGASGAWKTMPGLFAQLLATSGTTGPAFGIDKAAYRFWRPGYMNTSAGNFGLTTLTDCVKGVAEIGGGEDLVALVPFKAWAKLNADGLGDQTFFNNDTSMKRVAGTQEIELMYQGTKCAVLGIRYCKDGEMAVVTKDVVRRIAVGPEINMDYKTGSPFFLNENEESLEQRARTLQAIFIEQPAKCGVVTGITYA